MHRSNVVANKEGDVTLRKPWNNEEVNYPDAEPTIYNDSEFSFAKL